MILRPALLAAFLSGCLAAGIAAEPGPSPAPAAADTTGKKSQSRFRELFKARMTEEAKKAPPPAAKSAQPPAADAPAPAPVAAKDAAAKDTPTVLPPVEVRRDRITVLDHNLALQEKEIAREKVNTQPTELDKALNDSKVTKALSIFGGESADHRASISQERVSMMEEEKDIIEAIARARTKEEKAELQKQLDELKAYRRELEKALR